MVFKTTLYLVLIGFILIYTNADSQPRADYNLRFDTLASRWDEAIPIGNGWLGALIWQRDKKVRLSLDRVDLWDDRPMPIINQLKFRWVIDQVHKNQYDTVQKIGDDPYEINPAPTKLPAAAIEFNCSAFGRVTSNVLDLKSAIATIQFEDGTIFRNYVHATKKVGYFEIFNIPSEKQGHLPVEYIPEIKIPAYNENLTEKNDNSHSGGGLQTLNYSKGMVIKKGNSIRYHQPIWSGNYYEVLVQWHRIASGIVGSWTITINKAASLASLVLQSDRKKLLETHELWWKNFWNRSEVNIPDKQLARQYYLEVYKMGCVARSQTPPISLQAVWTADNGKLPPWKGDIHHDLNTELSYWPFYTGNYLEESASFINWLWKTMEQNKKWTKNYFEISGLNVPGVTTISGKEMGGWIQYSMSPTTVAWLCQHFYWQWKYSMDNEFLLSRCKPYFDDAYRYFQSVLNINPGTGLYQIPLSSSPEIFDNSIKAWFTNWTNYDLSLVKSFFREYAEIFKAATGKPLLFYDKIKMRLPDLNTDSTGLTIAPGLDYFESHRHLSPYMSIYPLGLLDIENNTDSLIVEKSLHQIESKGTRLWCGYSFAWMASLYANARKGDSAARMLKIFANNFCSINSFHLNGDQKGGQYSAFTYRPFTLEGNFAFAKGIQEMLLQSHRDYIEVFPAIPNEWKDASFSGLRAQGAFLVSAKMQNGMTSEIKVYSEKGGLLRIKLPWKQFSVPGKTKRHLFSDGIYILQMKAGETTMLVPGMN